MLKNKLKEIRMKEYMLNQKDFAARLGLDYRQYNRYEHGTIPDLETAIKISSKLDKKVEEIFYFFDE